METGKILLHNKKAYIHHADDLFSYYTPHEVVEADPTTHFRGGKITFSLWYQIVAFMLWSYKEFNSEALIQLFYNETTHEWKAWAMPQYIGTGMTVSQVTDEAIWEDFRATQQHNLAGFEAAGSVHHHCSSGAFQSGTDHSDEKNKTGLHITLGNLNNAMLSIHGRVSHKQSFWEPIWEEWFELPPEYAGVFMPPTVHGEVIRMNLCRLVTNFEEDGVFPAEWKTNCMRRTYTQQTQSQTRTQGEYGGRTASWKAPSKWSSLIYAAGNYQNLALALAAVRDDVMDVVSKINELVMPDAGTTVSLDEAQFIADSMDNIADEANEAVAKLDLLEEHCSGLHSLFAEEYSNVKVATYGVTIDGRWHTSKEMADGITSSTLPGDVSECKSLIDLVKSIEQSEVDQTIYELVTGGSLRRRHFSDDDDEANLLGSSGSAMTVTSNGVTEVYDSKGNLMFTYPARTGPPPSHGAAPPLSEVEEELNDIEIARQTAFDLAHRKEMESIMNEMGIPFN